MKLFTKEIDKKLFQQYPYGSDLDSQKVVAKIFNPYGRGTWYLLNSDPADPDYLWAIVDLFEVEVGSVSRTELESIKVKPFGLGLERDLYFSPVNAKELYEGLQSGKRYAKGGISDVEVIEKNNEAYLGMPQIGKGSTMVKLEHGGNLDMLKNQAVQFKHHAEELHNVLKNNPNVDAWVVAKAERASTDLSDITHYLEGSEKMAKGGQLSMFEQGGGTFSNKIIYTHKYIPTMTLEVLDYTNKGVKGLQKDSKSLSKKERSNGIIVYYSDAEIKDLWQKKFADGGNILSEDTVARVDDPAFADVSMYYKGGYIDEEKYYLVVSETKDGYWTIMSKPNWNLDMTIFTKNLLTVPRGETLKVVNLLEAKNHKKVIGKKYLEEDNIIINKSDFKYAKGGKSKIYMSGDEFREKLDGMSDEELLNYYVEENGFDPYDEDHKERIEEERDEVIDELVEDYVRMMKSTGRFYAKGGQIQNGSLVRVKKYGWIMRVDKIEGNMYYLENDRRGTMNGNAGSYLASDIELVMAGGGGVDSEIRGGVRYVKGKDLKWYDIRSFDIDEYGEQGAKEKAEKYVSEYIKYWKDELNQDDFKIRKTAYEYVVMRLMPKYAKGGGVEGGVDDKLDRLKKELENKGIYVEKTFDIEKIPYLIIYPKDDYYLQHNLFFINKIGKYEMGNHYWDGTSEQAMIYDNINGILEYVDNNTFETIKERQEEKDRIEVEKSKWLSPYERFKKNRFAKGGGVDEVDESTLYEWAKNIDDENLLSWCGYKNKYDFEDSADLTYNKRNLILTNFEDLEYVYNNQAEYGLTNTGKVGDKESEYKQGGKTTFKDKVSSIKAKLLRNKKVPKAVQKDYGKTFSPAEAEDSAKRIAGAMRKKEMAKK